jgi:ABC-type glycerol-3-phosphate transport system substrate-binding protein
MNYHILDSLDLRAFDNREKDYGVHNYLETLGFVPDAVTLLECSVEQVHSYNGIIDNATVPYLWTCEREMPGGNVWSQRQLYGLVEELHKAGTKFFFGALAQPNIHDEYNTRAEWLMEHADEYDIFIMTRDGGSLRNTSPEALKGFEFVNELAKTCPKGFLEGRGAENFGTENNNIAMWYSQNLVSNYQKTESLGLTDRYGYAYSPVLENGREGWANFTGDWNMAIAKNAQSKEACWEFIKWMATNQDIADWCWEGGKIPNNKEAIERLSAENIPFADVFFNTLAATPDNFTIFASEYDDAFLGSSNAFKANGLSAMFAGDLTPEEAAENIQAAYEEQAASYQ